MRRFDSTVRSAKPVAVAGIAVVSLVGACAPSPVGPVRFKNAAPVWVVNDRVDTPEAPEDRPFLRLFYHFDSYFLRARRGFDLTRDQRSRGVNALDEVPDSTWFTNRPPLSAAEIEEGPGPAHSPDQHRPWTIKSAKAGGASVGFVCEDSAGTKFVLKFDERSHPEIETAANVIVGRLFWAAGWNVSSDHVVYFKQTDFKIDKDATYKLKGEKVPLDMAYVEKQLARVNIQEDGTIRGMASIFVEGKPRGGTPRLGTREDDPNDRIPHELRRDMRGQAALSAWLSVSDAKEDQSIDTWIEDPGDKSKHYMKHYLIDFGKSLGAYPAIHRDPIIDYQYQLDFKETLLQLLSLGLRTQSWEDREMVTGYPGVGIYSAKNWEPTEWKPNPAGQFPIIFADRIDQFWGSKLLIRFTEAQIAAAVKAGRLTNAESSAYLVKTLVARQRITARYWFERVNPIDEIAVKIVNGKYRLCFVDLAVRHGLADGATTFTTKAYDNEERFLGDIAAVTTDAKGDVCLPDLPMATDGERYTIYEVGSTRGIPGTSIHVAIDPQSGAPRVIGIYRR